MRKLAEILIRFQLFRIKPFGWDVEHPHFRWGTLDFPRDLGADAARYELELVKIVLTFPTIPN